LKKIFFDTNLILDFALKREPFYDHSNLIFENIGNDVHLGFVSTSMITDIYYLLSKRKGNKKTIAFLKYFSKIITFLNVTPEIIIKSIESEPIDFEDAIQYEVALTNSLDYLITRNKKDFPIGEVKVLSPKEFLDL
jgi:predicted nucleic acid-binding protein